MAIDSSVQSLLNLTSDICRNIGHRESPLHPHESVASLGARRQAGLELIKQLVGLRAVWEAAVGSAPHLSGEVIELRDAVVDAIHCHGRLQRVGVSYTALEVAAYQSNQSNGKPAETTDVKTPGKKRGPGRPTGTTDPNSAKQKIINAIKKNSSIDNDALSLRFDVEPEYVAKIRRGLDANTTPTKP